MMKNIFKQLAIILLISNLSYAQCGDSEICNSNTGLYSNDDAASIAYDNMGSGFHSTFIREPNGAWRVWGEYMANNGTSNLASPISVNSTNYPALTGTIYKMGIGSDYAGSVQMIILTSTGLFVSGSEGTILDYGLTTGDAFQKVTVNGKADGLPLNVTPVDVKMLFVTDATLILTTCTGEVYVLSQNDLVRGVGTATSSALQWSKVMETATQPLSNVIVARGSSTMGFALKANGSIWTWGESTFLANANGFADRNFATQMTLPAGMPGVKSIQVTSDGYYSPSYYILGTDKKLYSLGFNDFGQLGDRTTTDRLSWVNAKNPDNTIITDAAWISTNEHDPTYPSLALIKTGGILYTAGANALYMIGRTVDAGINYLALPAGVTTSDVITYAEAGGHTCALIKLGSIRYGYVGHRINGSMGDGTITSNVQQSYDFISPPIVAVCGTLCVQPVVTTNAPICPGQNAVFTITGTPGDIVSYKINGGGTQTIVIAASGSVNVTINSPVIDQTITLVYVLGGTGSCSNILSLSQTISLNGSVIPVFNQVSAICEGQALNPLPTTSTNGIAGSWSPAINNMATTTYTFTPTSTTCGLTASMTISVLPTGTTPTFTPLASICEASPFPTLPTISLEGIDGTWSPAPNNISTTTYTFTPNNIGCLNTAQMTIAVVPMTTTLFTQAPSVCTGTVMTALPTTSDNGIAGTWSPALNNTLTTTYTFTPATGVCATSTSMTIIITPTTTPTFAPIASVCEGTVLSPLPTTSTNAIVGVWSPAFNNLVTTLYTFTPTTSTCATTAQATVVVNPKLNPSFTSFNTLCFGDSIFSLPLVSNNSVHGTWLPAINNTQTTTYTFTPNSGECANTSTMTIGVYEDFDFEYIAYCKENNFYLEVKALNQSFDLNTASVNWEYNNTTAGSTPILNVTSFINSQPNTLELPIVFNITVTNANGCDKVRSVTVDNDFCGVQRGISVNNDNLNDYFDLRLLDVKKLTIFNRYGMIVYDKPGYYNEWKGQSNDGDELPDGSYFYVIDFNNTENPAKLGWIYLNRETN
jgi:gliding motility-associated-like protein